MNNSDVINHQKQFEALKEQMNNSILKAVEIQAAFAVMNAAITGGMEQAETNPHHLETHHLVTLIELFSERADDLSSVLSVVKHDYEKLFHQMAASDEEVQS